ncbi:hypothetical protein [Sinisalibacter lacisalsi]|uniref:hypothetical protein n=1 Tax=Sinisalibacter lacisalsi TaxID=1526570 RepID=UPI00166DEAF5|nr:hypothetical protein [Sinisalibacter lacisalsi]
MQIVSNQDQPTGDRSTNDVQREILAILAESGLVPGQGVEALLDRFSGDGQTR